MPLSADVTLPLLRNQRAAGSATAAVVPSEHVVNKRGIHKTDKHRQTNTDC